MLMDLGLEAGLIDLVLLGDEPLNDFGDFLAEDPLKFSLIITDFFLEEALLIYLGIVELFWIFNEVFMLSISLISFWILTVSNF